MHLRYYILSVYVSMFNITLAHISPISKTGTEIRTIYQYFSIVPIPVTRCEKLKTVTELNIDTKYNDILRYTTDTFSELFNN